MAKNALQQIEDAPQENAGVEEVVIGGASSSVEELDAMFDDLELNLDGPSTSSIVVNGLPEQPEVHDEAQLIAAGRAATNEELQKLAIEEMNENSEHHPEDAQTPAAQTKKKAPVTKRISTAGMAKSEALATALGDKLDTLLMVDSDDLALPADEQFDKRIALLERIDGLPKKIGEKATNLFAHVSKGAQLSNYTKIAINLLAANGEMTSKQLKDTYLARPYSEGTASSQTTQLMNLLPALGIAKKEAGKLVVNPTSTLFPVLTAAAEAAPESLEDDAE
ncbi:hypothetical protein CNR34_00102 [Pseudomonas phage nickie]|uniref:Uncharacterized protein n=1 Tax=Pseudomonas phage nickie TaxID=2048977 RepID=A0A2H4P788_9CAUD|nr:hypothetical protein FDJ16_gp063 [Pseudomonas phage nickie]ATW58035.1 hypothetical protein CNR34_00102 [Pseudomonas phage nickie]